MGSFYFVYFLPRYKLFFTPGIAGGCLCCTQNKTGSKSSLFYYYCATDKNCNKSDNASRRSSIGNSIHV